MSRIVGAALCVGRFLASRRVLLMAALVVLGGSACVPFVMEGPEAHFAAADFADALPEGTYAAVNAGGEVEPRSAGNVTVVTGRRSLQIEMFEKGKSEGKVFGGLVPLGRPGLYIFQGIDPDPKQQQSNNKAIFAPVRVAGDTLELFFGFTSAIPAVDALLAKYAFTKGESGWRELAQPMPRATLIAFYEELAVIIDDSRASPAWEVHRLRRVAR